MELCLKLQTVRRESTLCVCVCVLGGGRGGSKSTTSSLIKSVLWKIVTRIQMSFDCYSKHGLSEDVLRAGFNRNRNLDRRTYYDVVGLFRQRETKTVKLQLMLL